MSDRKFAYGMTTYRGEGCPFWKAGMAWKENIGEALDLYDKIAREKNERPYGFIYDHEAEQIWQTVYDHVKSLEGLEAEQENVLKIAEEFGWDIDE